MLSARFRQLEQFLPRVQALVWDFASAAPSALDTSPPCWFVAVAWLGEGPSRRYTRIAPLARAHHILNARYFLPTEQAMTWERALAATATGFRFPTAASS